ncbi:hypothetical protein DMB65_13560 [Flavobacterium cheongpyeongense]|jgi:hypothetical protein|uniref:TonB-dependent receptor n=1 Tax=Flavobacterium cheongpyeongense TaxID=2212651 RepID=A0A2V4BMW5_9FLAO|nr:hypothetical protein [Flavobacterium cheongpyeongense]PXY40346.1 hypothetical protein DMB65_13560 [Flavobacterium cheongpyeongense]
MKKLALTTGLFSLAMVLTSLNTSATTNDTIMNNTRVSIDGNQSVGQSRKVDVIGSDLSKQTTLLSIDGNQSVGQSRKVD